MDHLKAAFAIASRNLLARRINRVIGLLLVASAALMVVAGTLRRHIGEGTRTSITHSFIGDLQVFPDRPGRDTVIYPPFNAAERPSDARPMESPEKVREALLTVENVRGVVLQGALLFNHEEGNAADRILLRLRQALNHHRQTPSTESRVAVENLAAHVRQLVALLDGELVLAAELLPPDDLAERRALLERFASDAYWEQLWTRTLELSEELENQLAPLFADGMLTTHLFLGADLQQLGEVFPRLRISEGTGVPPGERGVLLSRYNYEDAFKLKSVRELDLLHEAVTRDGAVFSEDPELQTRARALPSRTRDIVLQLDPVRAAEIIKRLSAALGMKGDAATLVEALFTVDTATIDRNRQLFYAQVAPLLDLYSVKVGESLVLEYQQRAGYIKSLRVPLRGTYVLEGLSLGSSASQVVNLMDATTFAELHGTPSASEDADLRELLESFEQAANEAGAEDPSTAALARAEQRIRDDAAQARLPSVTPPNPVVFHAAVVLDDPGKSAETAARIDALLKARGLEGESIGWSTASGPFGAFASAATGILLAAIVIIFVVIALLLNNTTLIATLQRIPEFGTLRALGAQRRFVALLVLLEALLLALTAGLIGTGLGVFILTRVEAAGISAGGSDILAFFFGGERLHLVATAPDLIISLVVVVVVTVGAALYPAVLANGVSPLRAMQAEE